MTKNLKSLIKFEFKTQTKSTQKNTIKKKKKFKNFLKFTTKSSQGATSNRSRYNCKNKKIDTNYTECSNDDTISNLLPFKAIPTQILIPPPPPLPQSTAIESLKVGNQIELKLLGADKLKPANLPMLVVKSYKANKTISLKQVSIHKGSAVNALYMLCNNWVYVKTADDEEGFVPKYCFEPFTKQSCMSNQNLTNENTNHTYMSIMDNNNEIEGKLCEEEDEENEDITNLSLFSVSRCVNIDSTILTTTTTTSRRTTKSVKSYSKKFYYKSTINSRQLNLRRKSKRNEVKKQQQQQVNKKRRYSLSTSSSSTSIVDAHLQRKNQI